MHGRSLVSHSLMARTIRIRARTPLAVRTLAQRASIVLIGVLRHASVYASLQERLTLEPRRSSRTRQTASRIVTMFRVVWDTRTSASHLPSWPKSTRRHTIIHAASGNKRTTDATKRRATTDGRRPSVARLASRATVSRRSQSSTSSGKSIRPMTASFDILAGLRRTPSRTRAVAPVASHSRH